MGGLLETLANYNPSGFATANQQAEANLAHTQAQVPLIQAQTTAQQAGAARTQLENQEIQRQIDAAKKMADLYRNPAVIVDEYGGSGQPRTLPSVNTSIGTFLKAGYTYPEAVSFATKAVEYGKNALALTNEQRQSEQAVNDLVGQRIENIESLPQGQRAAAWAGMVPELSRLDPSFNWGTVNAENPAELERLKAQTLLHGTVLAHAKTAAETQNIGSETAKNTAQAGLATAETPGAQAESERKQLITKAMKDAQNAQQSGVHPVDSVLPPTIDAAQNRSYKAAYNAVMANAGPEAANHVLESAAGYAADVAKANNPQIRAGEVAKSVATEAALTPLRIHQQVQAEVEKARLAPDSFNAIVDPRARQEAMSQYQKDSTEFADKVGQAQQLKDFVAAAQSGNKAAPGLIPITEVRGLVNRVNRQELESVSSAAGSAWDHVQGFFNKWTEGQPIPPEVLKDTAEIASTMQKSAERTYHMKVEVNNKTHGGNVKPISFTQETHSAIPEITSQADYDKLPKGSQYTHNGEVLTKR